jgi:nicotinamidase-related amidase
VTCERDRSVLLMIDLQERLMPQIAGSETVLRNARRLGEAARLLGVPVLATEQNPTGLGGNAPAIAELAERTLAKNFFDARPAKRGSTASCQRTGRGSWWRAARPMSASCRPCSA